MSRNEFFSDQILSDRLSYLAYTSAGTTNDSAKKRMKKLVKKAIDEELSYMQRQCLIEYYIGGKKMKDIAAQMNLNPSTVTRHIKRATEKLRHIAGYY